MPFRTLLPSLVSMAPISPAVSKVKLSDRINESLPLIFISEEDKYQGEALVIFISEEDKFSSCLLGSTASNKFAPPELGREHDAVTISKTSNISKRMVKNFKIRLYLRMCAN